jgi:hypothetical protein
MTKTHLQPTAQPPTTAQPLNRRQPPTANCQPQTAPQEYYFHCMAGREGLVDTTVKTSRSGELDWLAFG